jgi:hypothetical protein
MHAQEPLHPSRPLAVTLAPDPKALALTQRPTSRVTPPKNTLSHILEAVQLVRMRATPIACPLGLPPPPTPARAHVLSPACPGSVALVHPLASTPFALPFHGSDNNGKPAPCMLLPLLPLH